MSDNKFIIPLSIIIAGALVAGAVFFSGKKDSAPTETEKKEEVALNPVTESDHIMGNPNAPVVIVEYSDTECPFCKQFHTTMNRIIEEYAKEGKVAWVYRHFPIDQLHPKARKEAEALECANELAGNNGFWAYTNRLYEVTPSNNGLDADELPKIAKEVGLDVEQFNTCLASGKYKDHVQSDYQDGVRAGAEGTPYSVIVTKDRKIPITQGALPFEAMKQIIDAILGSS
ncbi:MAG: thioredoxin domain-containing protein [bacterium]|nr:thioredoxin domain-containing protein [bacterium]